MSHVPRPMNAEAVAHLTRVDPVLGRVIRRVGPPALRPQRRRSPFESLVRAVANQQLNGKAAATILGRFCGLFPGKPFPKPEDLAGVTDATLRGCGFSGAKVAAIRDITERAMTGRIPTSRVLARWPDERVVEVLTEARGVGRWTVEMLLIFQMGRPDVLPADDFGVRTGFQRAYGLESLPAPKAVLAHGERWRPHRTTASWYLWRVLDV